MNHQPPPGLNTPMPSQPSTDDYRQLIDSFAQAVWEADAAGQIVDDSPSWRAYTGQTTAQWLGEGWTDAVHPHQRQAVLEQWRQAVEEQKPVQAEYQLQHAQGGWRWTSVRATPVFEPDGSVRKWIGLNVDITGRKRAEEALRQSEQKYHTLFESIDEGFCLIQLLYDAQRQPVDWLYLEANPTFERQLGVNPVGQTASQVVGSVEAYWLDFYHQVLLSGQPARTENYVAALDRWYRIYAAPVGAAGDQLTVVFDDSTARKQQEAALRSADRRKDEFLAMLAHELRNPMATLRSGLDILNLVPQVGSIVGQAVSLMNRQLDHLVRLVDDLLDVSRISQGKIELKRERVELGTLVAEAVDAMGPLCATAHKSLHLTGWASPLWVDGDPTRLSQLVSNLLTNGVRYTGAQGQVRISLRAEQGQAVLRVADNGIGLAADQLTAIFEWFVQVDTSLVRSQGGLGIGLTLAQRLAQLHGGRIEAHSPGLGQGSEFVVFLPLLAEFTVGVESVASAASTPLVAHRLLVIDDNADAALTLSMLLKLKGYAVTTALSGLEGLQVAQALQPRVILCDLSMPGMDGYEVCRRLRGQAWGASIVMIALTGYGQAEDRQRTKAAGFDAHLVKPIDLGVLTQLLQERPLQG